MLPGADQYGRAGLPGADQYGRAGLRGADQYGRACQIALGRKFSFENNDTCQIRAELS